MICERMGGCWSALGTALLGVVLLPLWVVALLLVAVVVWLEEWFGPEAEDNSGVLYPTLSKLHPGAFREPQNCFEKRKDRR